MSKTLDKMAGLERSVGAVSAKAAHDKWASLNWQKYTSEAIAAFEQALLSDEVVEAASRAANESASMRDALQAALAAAKGKEDEQEDCGCTSIDYGWYGNDGGIVNDIQCSDEGCPRAAKGTEEGSE